MNSEKKYLFTYNAQFNWYDSEGDPNNTSLIRYKDYGYDSHTHDTGCYTFYCCPGYLKNNTLFYERKNII